MRVVIVGIGTESSGFAPHRTTLADFGVRRGSLVMERYPFLLDGRLADLAAVRFVPGVVARALPGGRVQRSAYDALLAELLDVLREGGPWDGVLLDIHGAMLVDGMDDAEAHLARAVREVVGPRPLIAAAMDLHGSVSETFVEVVDLPTCYRTAPHVDEEETRERAARLLATCLTDGVRPVRAWARVPVILPGEKTSTRDEPARSVYASLADDRRPNGVLETALWVGYAWADEPRTAAAVVSLGIDEATVRAEAERVARAWFDAREEFEFCCETGDLAWTTDRALSSQRRPFFVSDTGENPTAGGSGDVASTLAALLANRSVTDGVHQVVWSALVDPEGVASAHALDEGAAFDAVVGGCFGWPDRVRLQGNVVRCTRGEVDSAVIAVGSLRVVLTDRRMPFHAMSDYAAVGIDPSTVDVFVDKIGYLEPDLHEHAAGWVMALTDGPVDQRIERLTFERVEAPLHPLTPVPARLVARGGRDQVVSSSSRRRTPATASGSTAPDHEPPARTDLPRWTARTPARTSRGRCSTRNPPPTITWSLRSPAASTCSSRGRPASTPAGSPEVRTVSQPGRASTARTAATRSGAVSTARWNVNGIPPSTSRVGPSASRSGRPSGRAAPSTSSLTPAASSRSASVARCPASAALS